MLPADRDEKVMATNLGALKSALAMLEAGLADGRAYIGGAEFSVADIALGSLFYRILDLFPDILSSTPHVADWQARIAARPGYQTYIATSYDELKVTS